MSEEFHNPYHFAPVKARKDFLHDLSVSDANAGEWGRHSHATYSKDKTYSGRLICRLDTVSPIVIGAEQVEGTEPKEIKPFELDNEPAIPASTLRGLLSGIAEAASNSALRVLDCERHLTYRKQMGRGVLSALGMVMEEKGEFRLRPLTLPTLDGDEKAGYQITDNYKKLFSEFKHAPLKVYLNAYSFDSASKTFVANGFLAKKPKNYSSETEKFYYFKLDDSLQKLNVKSGRLQYHSSMKTKSRQDKKAKPPKTIEHAFLLGQISSENSVPVENEHRGYMRGIIRVLGVANRPDMAETKKHEFFIPYPEEIEQIKTIPISAKAIRNFNILADERTRENSQLPYEPIGTKRNLSNDPGDNSLRLKHGDIVYFAPNADGSEVAEVSFSSIWRGHAGTVGDYFDSESLPFHEKREHISPAELMFGFVQEKRKDDENKSSLAFKGKVRVSFGRLTGWPEGDEEHYHDPVTMKILASPKPPSPALYFKFKPQKEGDYISKAKLSTKLHEPQGRKYYLHRYDKEGLPWKSLVTDPKLNNQKNRVTPLKEKRQFLFHIDFDNLTAWELGLLCFAAQPFPEFHHKIGMGKPIGLGTVKIEPVGLFCIDRQQRYTSNGLFAGRYHQAWLSDKETALLPARLYLRESQGSPKSDGSFSFAGFRKTFVAGMDQDIKQALYLLGDPAKVVHPVHTPQVQGGNEEFLEQETFLWFVANDIGKPKKGLKAQMKNLEPLTEGSKELPTLPRHEWKN